MDVWAKVVTGILVTSSSSCSLLLIYGFIKLKEFKEHPGKMIFIQCIFQLFRDLHWVTVIISLDDNLTDVGCKIVGSIAYVSFLMAWHYTFFLSLEVYLKVIEKYKTNYYRRLKWYHIYAATSSLVLFIVVVTKDQNGKTSLGTCLIESGLLYNLFVPIPVALYMPLCSYLMIISYIKLKENKSLYSAIKYHIYVVLMFIITYSPTGIYASLKCMNIFEPKNFYGYIVIFIGSMSGTLIFIVRVSQKNLLKILIKSIFSSKEKNPSSELEKPLTFYNHLFRKIENNVKCS